MGNNLSKFVKSKNFLINNLDIKNSFEKNNKNSFDTKTYLPKCTKLKALFNFDARKCYDINIKKGDKLELIDSSDQNWWICYNLKTKKKGFVPSNYVAIENDCIHEPWFFGNICKKEAERYLTKELKKGMFLIRKSKNIIKNETNLYTLSVCDGTNIIKHYRIKFLKEGKYYIIQPIYFDSLNQLVAYYIKKYDNTICCKLKNSPCKIIPSTYGLGFNTWEEPKINFKIISLISSGNFGQVWKALYKDKTIVAIKTIKEENMVSNNFYKEVNIMKMLYHPNLVQLLAICCESEPFYIVTEYIDNGSLLDFLNFQNNPILLQNQIDMFWQIANGMSFLETKLFVHRDLAARNILVTSNFIYKISDFGLSKIICDNHCTIDSRKCVPIRWTAIEALISSHFSTKSDVWSFGIVMYEILTNGKLPYIAFTNKETIDAVKQGYRLPIPINCSKIIYNIMLKCWNSNPKKRPTFKFLAFYFLNFNLNI